MTNFKVKRKAKQTLLPVNIHKNIKSWLPGMKMRIFALIFGLTIFEGLSTVAMCASQQVATTQTTSCGMYGLIA